MDKIYSTNDNFGWTTEVIHEGNADDQGSNVITVNQFDKFDFRMIALTKDEAMALSSAIIAHFIKDQPK